MTAPAAAARSQDVPSTGQDFSIHNSYTQKGEKLGVKASTSYYSDSGNSVTYLTPTDAKGQTALEKDKRLVAVEKDGNKVFIPRQDVATHQKYNPSAAPAKASSFQGASPDKALKGAMSGKPQTVMMANLHGKGTTPDSNKITGFKDLGGANQRVASQTKPALKSVFSKQGNDLPKNPEIKVNYQVKADGKIDPATVKVSGNLKPEQLASLESAARQKMAGLQLDPLSLKKANTGGAFPLPQSFSYNYVQQGD